MNFKIDFQHLRFLNESSNIMAIPGDRVPELLPGAKLETQEAISHLPLLSVVRDEDGIDAVRLWATGAPEAHWVCDMGKSYIPELPVTILSVPSEEAKKVASKGYILDEDARRYWDSQPSGLAACLEALDLPKRAAGDRT